MNSILFLSAVPDAELASTVGDPFLHPEIAVVWAIVGIVALSAGLVAVRISRRRLVATLSTVASVPVTPTPSAGPASEKIKMERTALAA